MPIASSLGMTSLMPLVYDYDPSPLALADDVGIRGLPLRPSGVRFLPRV